MTATPRDAQREDDAPPAAGPGPSPRLWPLYAGGFLGPFGGAMTTPMLPELAHGLSTSLSTAAWAVTAYMIPFASLMLVSGTLAERWGRARAVRSAYVLYVAASLLCAVASSPGLFLAGRALQGTANAFTSPLLIAMIAQLVPPGGLGRALGRYGSLQAAGQAFAPLIGGAAAAVDYRWAFAASAVAAAVLTAVTPSAGEKREREAPAPWRALANRRLALAAGTAFGMYLSTTGATLLVALFAGDRFGLGPDARGLVVAAFGVAGLLLGGPLGRLADRHGARAVGTTMFAVFGAAVAVAGLSPSVAVLVGVTALTGAASTGARIVVNSLAVTSTPANRGGATSITLAFQFTGAAVAPLAWLPVYHADARTGFAAAASGAVLGVVLLLLGRRSAA